MYENKLDDIGNKNMIQEGFEDMKSKAESNQKKTLDSNPNAVEVGVLVGLLGTGGVFAVASRRGTHEKLAIVQWNRRRHCVAADIIKRPQQLPCVCGVAVDRTG